MRDIKFRGKRLDNNEWVYGYAVFGHNNTLAWIITDGYDAIYGINPDQNLFRVNPETVGQYANTKDKHSHDIYENDMLKDSNSIAVVKYVDTEFIAMDITDNHGCNLLWEGGPEIIGNIHDNSKLLSQTPNTQDQALEEEQ